MDVVIIQKIKDQIEAADGLIEMVQSSGSILTIPLGIDSFTDNIYYTQKQLLEDSVEGWFQETQAVLESIRGEDDDCVVAFRQKAKANVSEQNFINDLKRKVSSARFFLNSLLRAEHIRDELKSESSKVLSVKPKKVFISHKSEDSGYADALIALINHILGADGDKLFCSSIQGYGIKQSRDILDALKAQFEEFDVYMIIIHSPRYYDSPICLNEMGAAWVLGTQFSSFMTTDCNYEDMKGVINNGVICINPKDKADQLDAHLNDFKNDLLEFFEMGAIDENKWATAKRRFIREVTSNII